MAIVQLYTISIVPRPELDGIQPCVRGNEELLEDGRLQVAFGIGIA